MDENDRDFLALRPVLAMQQASNDNDNGCVDDAARPNAVVPPKKVVSKVFHFCSQITVQPTMFFFMMAISLMMGAYVPYVYDSECERLYGDTSGGDVYPSAICANLTKFKTEEAAVQRAQNTWSIYYYSACSIPAIPITLAFGTVADRYSWRVPMVVSIFGNAVCVMTCLVFSYFRGLSPAWLVLPGLIGGITGASSSLFMACFGYIGYVVPKDQQTVQMVVMEGMIGLGAMVGSLINSFVLKHKNYHTSFFLAFGCNLAALLYTFLFVKDVNRSALPSSSTSSSSRHISASFWQRVKAIFYDPLHEAIKVFIAPREGYKRSHLIMYFTAFFVDIVVSLGVSTIDFQYLSKSPLSLTPSNITMLSFIKAGVASVGSLLLLPLLFHKLLKLSDTTILYVGYLSKMGFGVCYGLARTPTLVYVGLSTALFSMFTTGTLRSLASQLISKSEKGRIFAFVGAAEGVSFLLGDVIFNAIYSAVLDVDSLAGFPYFVSIGMTFIPLLLVIMTHLDNAGIWRDGNHGVSILVEPGSPESAPKFRSHSVLVNEPDDE